MLADFPQRILIEKDIRESVGKTLKELGLGNYCALICDPSLSELNRCMSKVLSASFDVDIIEFKSMEKKYIESLSKTVSGYNFVIGFGGGKAIDAAKYAAFLAKKKWVAFPTILSHDGVISSRAIINENGKKYSVDAVNPIAILADLNIIKSAPYRNIAAGVGDLISNFSAVEDWKIASKAGKEQYHTIMAELSLLSVRSVLQHPEEIKKKSYHGLEILLWSLISSGFAMNIYGSSRPCSGSEHNFSHALDMILQQSEVRSASLSLHGEQVALGTIVMTYLQGGDWKEIRDMMKKFSLPTTAKEIKIDGEILVSALVNAAGVRDRYTILNEKKIDEKKAQEVLKKTGII
ncbi:MAG: iron-containing alcohol dehydrogenase [Candidatus Aenigmatarchaeota archaeon]